MRIYNYQPRQTARGLRRRFEKISVGSLVTWGFRLLAAGIFLVSLLFIYYSRSLPDPNKLLVRTVPESTKIFASDNSLLYEIHGEVKRTQINLDQIAPSLKQATVAIEDKDFYQHSGISLRGLARSVVVDILSLSKSQGGSTITQQFVKNALLTKDKALSRKLKEIILSVEIEARFSKDDILKLYLNEIPYGRNSYGIEAAAQAYFGKTAAELTLPESAYLAALPQATTYYNPLGPNREALDARKDRILGLMKEQGYIDDTAYQAALATKVEFRPLQNSITAPHFVLYVQDYLARKYGESTLEQGGLKVYTTLDPKLQAIAEEAVKVGVEKNAKTYKASNAGLVAINPKNGYVLAMVGSKDYFGTSEPAGCIPGKNCTFEPNVNVTTADRQPGSSFKPYAYVTAFGRDFGYSPASMLVDVTTNFGTYGGKTYMPQNYDFKQHGPLSMRSGLAGSLNIPAVKTLALVGVDNVVKTARSLGITTPLANCGLSLVLGGCEVKLIDHVAAFSVFANQGIKNEKTTIVKIEDREGNLLEEYKPHEEQVLDPEAVYQLVNVMSDNNARSFIFGSRSPLVLGDRPVAAKTGTTQNWHDGWAVGFTPSLAAGVWVGNNDGTLMRKGADGVFVAGPIWNQFMREALKGTPAEQFPVPPGITQVTVDSISGKLPTQYTPETKTEVFASYNIPTEYDNVHIGVKIDSLTGLPATELTPPERITIQTYRVLHSEKPDNANWENAVVAWALANGYSYPSQGTGTTTPPGETNNNEKPTVTIVSPTDNETIAQLPILVTAAANSSVGIARADVLLDGELVQSLTSAPYVFSINRQLTDGTHSLSVHVVDTTGSTADSAVNVTVALSQPLVLSEPTNNSVAAFPLTLSAESLNNYSSVTFFYQINSSTKTISRAETTIGPDGAYHYSFVWDTPPKPGSYKLYAKTDSGISSQKVTITIP
jgi:1A family penicillin-binding protein